MEDPKTTPTGNFEIRNEAAETAMRSISDRIKSALPAGFGFALLLFETDKADGALFYSSSVERRGSLESVKEWLKRQEAQYERTES